MGYQSEHKLGFYWQMMQWSQKELQKKAAQEGISGANENDLVFPVLNEPMGELQMQEEKIDE